MKTWALIVLCACGEASARFAPRRESVDVKAAAPVKPEEKKPKPRPAPAPPDEEVVVCDVNEDPTCDDEETSPAPMPEPDPMPRLLITEIRATGPDWVELCNRGNAAADLAGLAVSDSKSDGTPKLSDAVRFADATMLTAGACVLLLGGQDTSSPTPTDACDEVVPTCWHGKWKISDGDGENIHLLDAADAILETVAYPAAATNDSQTYARRSDDTWAPADPTPGSD